MTTQSVKSAPTVAYVSQQHVVRDSLSEAPYKHEKVFLGLGITQMVLGIVLVIFGITLAVYASTNRRIFFDFFFYVYNDFFGRIATGVWCGCFFFTSGILGVISAKKKTRCLVIAALTMAIFSSLAALTLFGIGITGAVISTRFSFRRSQDWDVSAGIHSTLAAIAFIELVVSIIHAAYCCNCNCCEQPQQYNTSPLQIVSSGYANPDASVLPTSQPQAAYIQTALQPGSQMVQQPVVLTSAPMPQLPPYQVQQVPQTTLIQAQQPPNQPNQQ